MDATKPYKFTWFGDIHGPKPYKFIGFRGAFADGLLTQFVAVDGPDLCADGGRPVDCDIVGGYDLANDFTIIDRDGNGLLNVEEVMPFLCGS